MDDYKLPEDIQPLRHQCAGHRYGDKDSMYGLLESPDGRVIKPVQKPPKGLRELHFYQEVFSESCKDKDLLMLKHIIPRYYGMWQNKLHQELQYFQLEDLTLPFSKPCVLDIKVGVITWDPDASPDKIASEKSKYFWHDTVKFQLLGMRVQNDNQAEEFYSRKACLHFTPEQVMTKGFGVYFQRERGAYHHYVINALLHRLKSVYDWFHRQKHYKLFASSLLFVYEGDALKYPPPSHKCELCSEEPKFMPFSDTNVQEKRTPVDSKISSTALPEQNYQGFSIIDEKANQALEHTIDCSSGEGCKEACMNNNTKDIDFSATSEMTTNSRDQLERPVSDLGNNCPWFQLCDLRMIDFTHVFRVSEASLDENYLEGLESVIKYLKDCKKAH